MRRRLLACALVLVVLLAAVPGPVAAQETRSGGTVVVAADETVDGDLTANGGTVIVRGTVNGDLTAFAGTVTVDGDVTGDVEAFAGTVTLDGEIGGDVSAAAGSVIVGENAAIGGALEAGAGSVVIDGEIRGDATVGADELTLGETAVVGGDFEYDADTYNRAEGAQISGAERRVDGIQNETVLTGPGIPSGAFAVYGLLVNLALGAVLLLAFPAFSRALAGDAAGDPVRTGGVGLLALVGLPILLVLVAITIIGLPLSVLGFLLYGLLLWVGYVYGAYAFGAWLLSLADREHRWGALVLGLVVIALLGLVPVVGGLAQFAVLLLGFGALVRGLYGRYRARERTPPASATEPAPGESGETGA